MRFRFIAAAIAAVIIGATATSASATTTHTASAETARTTLAATAQSAMSAATMPAGASAVKTVRALANGQTVQTFRYNTASPDQVADVYYDSDWVGLTTKRKAIVLVHGGYWHNATRANSAGMAQRFLDAGFVVINIDYRVAADHTAYVGASTTGTVLGSRWPAQRIDVALAADWLKANAAQFGVDPNKIGVYGFSAGGHIALTAAGYYGTSRFKAAVAVAPILQPHRLADIASNGSWAGDNSSPIIVKGFGYVTSLIGCSYEPTWTDCGNKWDSVKPETYYGADKPYMLVYKGDIDPVEPITSLTSTEYWMDNKGQPHYTEAVAGRDHTETMITGTASADIARWNKVVATFNAM